MPRYKITYFKSYKVETDNENDAVGITDQAFTDDIREALSEGGKSKIHYIFNFNVQKIK